jgi:uncharacterized SAM-dependent methyltransferase
MLEGSKTSIIGRMDEHFNLVDLGAGDGTKTHIFIKEAHQLHKNFTYVPLDFSKESN